MSKVKGEWKNANFMGIDEDGNEFHVNRKGLVDLQKMLVSYIDFYQDGMEKRVLVERNLLSNVKKENKQLKNEVIQLTKSLQNLVLNVPSKYLTTENRMNLYETSKKLSKIMENTDTHETEEIKNSVDNKQMELFEDVIKW